MLGKQGRRLRDLISGNDLARERSDAYLQLVEPLDPSAELTRLIEKRGAGLHHICSGWTTFSPPREGGHQKALRH